MGVSLISNDLLDRFQEILDATENEINIISPFIGRQTAAFLADWLKQHPEVECNLITRFYREEFVEQVSSIYGLEQLLHAGAKIFALLDLHSKLYVFDMHTTMIGSANFTKGGFVSNHEICVLMDDEPEIAEQAQHYFTDLLEKIESVGGGVVTQEWIDEEKKHIPQLQANQKHKKVKYSNNAKKGAILEKLDQSVDLFESILQNTSDEESTGFWLKFEGTGEDRIPGDWNYLKMKGARKRDLNQTFFPKKPSGIVEDEILFLTIVSYDEQKRPTPIIIGYASTNGYKKQNVINDSDLVKSPWKHRFPYFVEFSNGKVIQNEIQNGVRLIDLYSVVGKAAFPTLSKRKKVSQRTLHSMHFRRSHIRITQQARDFLIHELNSRFDKHGSIELG